jgi:DNA (cytosine-5)-methyltransferase 1
MIKTDKTFYEFFAGIGLIRLGFEITSSGWNCIWANDNAIDKKEIYESNFGSSHFCADDIWKVKPDQLPGHAFAATASFPCTDVSVAGYRNGLKGKESSTFFAFSNLIKSLKIEGRQPNIIMLENVQGLLSSHKGNDIKIILESFCNLGYFVDIIEINAYYFTPQSRPRIFIFGVLPEIAESIMAIKKESRNFFEWELQITSNPILRPPKVLDIIKNHENLNWGIINLPKLNPIQSNLKEIIEEIPNDSKLWWSSDRCKKLKNQMSAHNLLKLNSMIGQDEYSYGTVYRRIRDNKSMAELRTDGIAGCLRTPKGGSSKQILVKAGKGGFNVRLLTPRECARLQGVHDSFLLSNDTNKALFGLGDAVCVPVIQWIVENVFEPAYNSLTNNIHTNIQKAF